MNPFRLLAMGLTLTVGALLAASPPCDRPGVIDFYPSGSGSGVCQDDPDLHAMVLVGNAQAGHCAACGPATRFAEDGPFGMRVPAAVSSALPNLVYTVQFDIFGIAPGNLYPSGALMIAFDDTGAQIHWLQVDSLGSLFWNNLNGPPGPGVPYSDTIISALNALTPGQCQTVAAVADGSSFSLYVDGQLVGGPFPIDFAYVRKPVDQLWFGSINGGGDVSPFFLSNVLISSAALVPIQTPVRQTCDPNATPTPTWTPTPEHTCQVSILLPPDLTVGMERTVIVTCTPVEMTVTPTQPVATATESETSAPSATVTQTPDPGGIDSPTYTPTATSSPTPGSCFVTGLSFDQAQNRVTASVAVPGRVSLFLLDGEGREYVVSGPAPSQAGALSRSIDYERLPSDRPLVRYERIGVLWQNAGGTRCREIVPLEKRFRYYGEKIVSQYNTPSESSPSCQSTAFTASCVQELDCSSATSTTFSKLFVEYVRVQGSALTNLFGHITGDLESNCDGFFAACVLREKFRKFTAPTGACGQAVAVGDFAIRYYDKKGFGGGTIKCGDQLALLNRDGTLDSSGAVRDKCPGCRSGRIDRYVGAGGCGGIEHYGSFLAIKYE